MRLELEQMWIGQQEIRIQQDASNMLSRDQDLTRAEPERTAAVHPHDRERWHSERWEPSQSRCYFFVPPPAAAAFAASSSFFWNGRQQPRHSSETERNWRATLPSVSPSGRQHPYVDGPRVDVRRKIMHDG